MHGEIFKLQTLNDRNLVSEPFLTMELRHKCRTSFKIMIISLSKLMQKGLITICKCKWKTWIILIRFLNDASYRKCKCAALQNGQWNLILELEIYSTCRMWYLIDRPRDDPVRRIVQKLFVLWHQPPNCSTTHSGNERVRGKFSKFILIQIMLLMSPSSFFVFFVFLNLKNF